MQPPSLTRLPRSLCICRRSLFPMPLARRSSTSSGAPETDTAPATDADVASSSILVHIKSTFQAYAARLPPPPHGADVSRSNARFVADLISRLAIDSPRTRRATHAMWAWRAASQASSSDPPGPSLWGSADGGESGAGQHLTRLLELSRSDDVAVVVFRWYGGVKLGSQRWKCISTVAKEALERGRFTGGLREPEKGTGGRSGQRKRSRHIDAVRKK